MSGYISREAAKEYMLRSIGADPEGVCRTCIRDEHDCQYDRCWTLMDFCERIENISYVPAADVVPGSDFRDCRNELCLRCGQYKTAHLGSCDGCRWRH